MVISDLSLGGGSVGSDLGCHIEKVTSKVTLKIHPKKVTFKVTIKNRHSKTQVTKSPEKPHPKKSP